MKKSNYLKATLSILLAFVMCVCLCFTPAPRLEGVAQADENASVLSIIPVISQEGNSVSLSIELNSASPAISGVLDFDYNSEYLSSPTLKTDLPAAPDMVIMNGEKQGNICVAFVSSSKLQNAALFNIVFNIADSCPKGTELVFKVNTENCELIADDTTTLLDFEIADASIIVYELGDVNMSGSIDTGDAVLTLQAAVGATTLADNQSALADCNAVPGIDVGDASMILQKAVNS